MAIRIGDWPDGQGARCYNYSEIAPFDRLAREVLFINNIAERQKIIDEIGPEAGEKVPTEIPRRYDMASNIAAARKMTSLQFIDAVRTGGRWDYKQSGHPELADFGNWNFGVVAEAWAEQLFPLSDVFREFFEEMALRGAGAYQEWSGTSREDWSWFGGDAPYGDDPVDQSNIKNGWEAEQLRSSVPLSDSGTDGP